MGGRRVAGGAEFGEVRAHGKGPSRAPQHNLFDLRIQRGQFEGLAQAVAHGAVDGVVGAGALNLDVQPPAAPVEPNLSRRNDRRGRPRLAPGGVLHAALQQTIGDGFDDQRRRHRHRLHQPQGLHRDGRRRRVAQHIVDNARERGRRLDHGVKHGRQRMPRVAHSDQGKSWQE